METNRDMKRKAKWENEEEYRLKYKIMQNYVLNLFEWKGLPDSINERYLERTLFHQGKILWFNDDTLGLLALAYTGAKDLNVYGEPTHFMVNNPVVTNIHRDRSDSVEMFNNMLRQPSGDIVRRYAKRVYELERSIDINSMAQRTPYLITTDQNRLLSLRAVYTKIAEGEPVIFGEKGTLNIDDITSIPTVAPYVADKLTDLRHDLLNDFYDIFGVSNANTDKKERLNTDEVQSNNAIVELAKHTWLDERKKACEKINKMFADILTEKISVDFKVKGVQDNGVLHNNNQSDNDTE